jgi:glycosyltransferase involved in cell wall biosynthesis
MKVLHVGKFYPPVPGGMERVVQSLCAATRGRLESEVLAFNTRAATVEEVVDGVRVTRVGRWLSAGSVPVAPAFASYLARTKADVMIVHEPNPFALTAYLLARPRIPLAVWFHSEVVRPRLQYRMFYAPVARGVYPHARRFIVSSPALAASAAALRPYRDRVSVIPFGVDVSGWRPDAATCRRAAEIRGGDPAMRVLFAGRHVAYKGVDVLIDATASLPVSLTVAGDGPMRRTWERRVGRSSRVRPVRFTGNVSDAELRAEMLACDVFVLPSVTPAEAFGFVQLEAMACGKPVVSTALASGVPWVNRDGYTGLVVPPGDVNALRNALGRLIADPGERDRLGEQGRARARDEFGIQAMADRLVALCAEVAAA